MQLMPSTKIHDLLDRYPFLVEFLAGYNPKFSLLKNKAMRETMGRMAKLSMVAEIGGVDLAALMKDIAAEIERQTGEAAPIDTGGQEKGDRDKLDRLKEIILSLHRGVEFETAKAEFDTLMSEIDPTQIAAMEEQLIREGMPATEVQRLCDLHVTMFKYLLEKKDTVSAPAGHPVHTYMAENEVFAKLIISFDDSVRHISSGGGFDDIKAGLSESLSKLALLDTHYVRKENQLFPFLEKHGVTGPSQVMWGIHDDIRHMLKDMNKAVGSGDSGRIIDIGPKFSRAVVEMIFKENSILYPMALDTLSPDEWKEIRKGEDEVGYAHVTPSTDWVFGETETASLTRETASGRLGLDTGALTLEQINLMLKHLPVEVSFVDENDEVRYYSDTRDRIFPRSPGVIGRNVRNCHPPKSLHIVERIVGSFKSGEKDNADFHIEMGGRIISIRYFAVRDADGVYRGTIEVTQDVTEFRRIEGEKRLLDWEKQEGE